MNRKDNLRLAATMPGVPARANSLHEDIAEEAIRYGQRYLDQVAQIEELLKEVERWRGLATSGEAEIARMKAREVEVGAQHDKKTAEMTHERDALKQQLTVVRTRYDAAAKILLEGIDTMNAAEPLRVQINIPDLTAAIEHKPEPLPLPSSKWPNEKD